MPQVQRPLPLGQFALIAAGSNATSIWGDARATVAKGLENARRALDSDADISRFFATPCFPAGAGPDFVNAAMIVRTALAPRAILDVLHAIEAEAGRERTVRWGQRTLDLDLIACGDAVVPDAATYALWRDLPLDQQAKTAPDQLILPHPRLQDRAFVLVPLADVAPDWAHPVSGRDVRAMLAALPLADRQAIVALP